MKLIGLLLLLILNIETISQIPVLDFAFRYASEADEGVYNSLNSINFINDTITVCGTLNPQTNIGINSDIFLNESSDYNVGVCVYYNNNFDILDSIVVAQELFKVIKNSNQSLISAGNFRIEENFDLSGDSPLIVDTMTAAVNSFFSSHNANGTVNWLRYGRMGISNFCLAPDRTIAYGIYGNYFKLAGINDTLFVNESYFLQNRGIIVIIDNNGNIQDVKLFADENNNELVNSCSYSFDLNEFSCGGRFSGVNDLAWSGQEAIVVNYIGNMPGIISYDNELNLTSRVVFLHQSITNSNSNFNVVDYDFDGNLYAAGYFDQGEYLVDINGVIQNFNIESAHSMVLIKLSKDKEFQWIQKMNIDDVSGFNGLKIDHNGFINACGKFDTFMEFEGTSTTLNGPLQSGFIARWTPEGELVWAYTISDGGTTSVNDICITPNNEMYIGGWFTTYSTDFDFDENTSFDLGTTNGEDAFLAKYTISDPEPDVFVEQGWQTTEATEGGASDVLYVRLSHTPASPVEVVVTPNAQIDLGNGAGNAITLNFAADATAVQQQVVNVTAFDDIIVEEQHTGNISFTINSSDAAFDVLAESSITVAITDNDVIGIDEQHKNLFSLSPNPAKDILNINFAQYQNNTVLHLYDETGQLVTTVNANGKSTSIDISKLAAGHYTMVMQNGSEKSSLVFVKR
jgi:hypothetical protein